jgi:hypothetical protein
MLVPKPCLLSFALLDWLAVQLYLFLPLAHDIALTENRRSQIR